MWVLRDRRRYGRDPDRGPVDRITRRTRRFGLVVIMITGLIGVVVAMREYESESALERSAAAGYPVVARVVSQADVVSPQTGARVLVAVRVEWRDRAQRLHQEKLVLRPTGVKTVGLWVSADGTASTHRHGRGETVRAAVVTGLVPVFVVGSWLATVYAALVYVLNRRAERDPRLDVDREWARVEPRWRRRLL